MKKSLLFVSILTAALTLSCTAPGKSAVVSNDVCPMTGKSVDKSAFVEYGNKHIYTCCEKCMTKVKADPASAAAKAFPNQ